MKKFLSMMLGLGLVLGAASMAFADDTSKDTTKKEKKAKKSKAKKTTDATTK
jgi:hypothetical protein